MLTKLQKLLLKIPKGKVSTYKLIGQKLKIHPRQAGRLLAVNPCPQKYPCYKIVRTDGTLGGYSAKEGIAKKIKLLRKDGIKVKGNKVVNLKKVIYSF